MRAYLRGLCVLSLHLGSTTAYAVETAPEKIKITKAVEFNTPEADAILAELKVFPAENAFNIKISDWPVAKNSQPMIDSIGGDKPLRYNPDMAFILVPPNQPKVDVELA